jgi:hypothetical protein
MSTRYNFFGGLVTDGLILNLDAAKLQSYSGSGTNWVNLINNSISGGTLTNGPTLTGSGKNLAITFDGTNDYTEVLDNSIIDFGTSNFTSNIWIYPNSSLTSNTEFGVINKNNGFQNSTGWGLELSTYTVTSPYQKLRLEGFNSGQSSWENSNVIGFVRTEIWSNVNLIRTGNKFELYINGSLSGTKINSNVGLNVDNSVNLTLGKSSTWQSYFKGNISNFNLFNRALSPFDIFQNFNAYKSRYGIPDIVTSGLTLNLDAGNPYSYNPDNTGSTTWVDTTYTTTGGTLINGTSYSDGTMVFDGVDNYVRIPYKASLNPDTITVSSWINRSLAVNYAHFIGLPVDNITWASPYMPYGIEYIGTSDTMSFTLGFTDNSFTYTYVNLPFGNNQWFNFTGTYDKTNVKIYINGVLSTTRVETKTMYQSTADFYIGTINSSAQYPLNGKIANVQVYNRALSQDEITQNFNATRGRYGI